MMDALDAFEQQVSALKQWMIDDALPFWAEQALDPTGGFYEDLTPDGHPRKDQPRRLRVQARQAYVYAHTHLLGWYSESKSVSGHAFQQIVERGLSCATDGRSDSFCGLAHILGPSHDIIDGRADTYDHAFMLLSCAWRYRAFNQPSDLKWADTIDHFLQTNLNHPDKGYTEGIPTQLPRRQNPHMHLLEAYLALFEATADTRYADRCRDIIKLFHSYILDRDKYIIREFFTDDWKVDPETGELIEPGHAMEWVWLLDQCEKLLDEQIGDIPEQLYENAKKTGTHDSSGFLIDKYTLSQDSRVPVTRRAWVQTEYLRAALVLSRRSHKTALSDATLLIKRLLDSYLNAPVRGGYIDRYGEDHEIISTVMPTSTLYHLLGATAEAVETLTYLRSRH